MAGQGGSCPLSPGPVKPDTSSLWVDLFSLDSVILIINRDLQLFAIRGRFFGDISHDKC